MNGPYQLAILCKTLVQFTDSWHVVLMSNSFSLNSLIQRILLQIPLLYLTTRFNLATNQNQKPYLPRLIERSNMTKYKTEPSFCYFSSNTVERFSFLIFKSNLGHIIFVRLAQSSVLNWNALLWLMYMIYYLHNITSQVPHSHSSLTCFM